MAPRWLLPLALAALALPLPSLSDETRRPGPDRRIPVILATDIGDDIDDTWALSFLLRSPELDLRLVLTDYGDTHYRARLAAKLLQVAGRTDVPVAAGLRQAREGGRQAGWLGAYALADYPGRVSEDGVAALVETVMASRERLTLLAIGPAPTLRAALEREPRIAPRLRLVGMYGSLRQGYALGSKPEAEWNVKADAAAARALLGAPWAEGVVTPLDTCARARLEGERFARVRASRDPLVVALLENYRLWAPKADWFASELPFIETRSSTLFDTVAVYLAIAQDHVRLERLGVRVGDDGTTTIDAAARPLAWATSWKDLPAFLDLLTSRLAGSTPARRPHARE